MLWCGLMSLHSSTSLQRGWINDAFWRTKEFSVRQRGCNFEDFGDLWELKKEEDATIKQSSSKLTNFEVVLSFYKRCDVKTLQGYAFPATYSLKSLRVKFVPARGKTPKRLNPRLWRILNRGSWRRRKQRKLQTRALRYRRKEQYRLKPWCEQ